MLLEWPYCPLSFAEICYRSLVLLSVLLSRQDDAYGNCNNLFLVVPDDHSLPLGGRVISPGVGRFPAKCVEVAVVVLV